MLYGWHGQTCLSVSCLHTHKRPDNENTQKSIRKFLFEHLEGGYEIRSIKIKKNEEILAKRRRDLKDVTISIIVE